MIAAATHVYKQITHENHEMVRKITSHAPILCFLKMTHHALTCVTLTKGKQASQIRGSDQCTLPDMGNSSHVALSYKGL